jgi:hypothetical protein
MALTLSGITINGRASAGAANIGPVDPYYSNVALLLHFDGTNGSQSFTDNSPTPKTVTAAGAGATLTTSQFKYGTASLNLSGASGAYVSSASNAAYNLGSGDYTIEGWIRTGSSAGVFFDRYEPGVGGIQLEVLSGVMRQYINGAYRNIATTALNNNAWHHIAATRSSNVLRLFVNGVLEGGTTNYTDSVTRNVPVVLGATQSNTGRFTGQIDDFRLTVGVARYVSNFTPPAAAFPNQ